MKDRPLEPHFWPEEPLFCPRCGTTIAADDLFCPRCGQKIERKTTSPGWAWHIGLLLLAITLFLCILGIGALGVYHGLEERQRLNQGASTHLPSTVACSPLSVSSHCSPIHCRIAPSLAEVTIAA